MSALEVRNWTFSNGMELKVVGVPKPNGPRFAINVGHSFENIALHFNPRFDWKGHKAAIVLNNKLNGDWKEEIVESGFPFEQGKEFEVSIVFNFDTFDIYLPDGKKIQFPIRESAQKYKYLTFTGDIEVSEMSMKVADKPTKRCC